MKSAFTNEQVPDPLDVKTEEAIDASVDVSYAVSYYNNFCGCNTICHMAPSISMRCQFSCWRIITMAMVNHIEPLF